MKLISYIIVSILATILLGVIVSIFIFPHVYFNMPSNNLFSDTAEAALIKKTKKDKTKTVRVFIDPGHDSKTAGARGVKQEYILNYELASILAKKLSEDKRFSFEMSRDINFYSENIKNYGTNNFEKLKKIIKTDAKGEKRSQPLSTSQYIDLYSIRNYAINNNFDCLLSIHFDYTAPKYRKDLNGFHIIVSPYNKEFVSSMSLAETLSKRMREKYDVSGGFRYDPKIPKHVWTYYNLDEIKSYGIALRSLIVLGDKYEYTYYSKHTNEYGASKDIPSILLETGYLHEDKFTNETVLKDIADRIYMSLCDVFLK